MTDDDDDMLKLCDEVLAEDAGPGHPMTKPHAREVAMARALKAIHQVLANPNHAGSIAHERINSAIERRLAKDGT